MPALKRSGIKFQTQWPGCVWLVLAMTAMADDDLTPNPSLKFDVAAAEHAADRARIASGGVALSRIIVNGKRSAADSLPCIGCDGRAIVPMHRLQDLSEKIGEFLIQHPPSRPDSPEDRALALAHEASCVDGFGCLLPK